MNIFIKFSILTFAIILVSCNKKKETAPHTGYTLQISLNRLKANTAYLQNIKGEIVDTASLNNKIFKFIGNTPLLDLYEIHFKNSNMIIPVWLQDQDNIYVYASPSRTFVYGSNLYDKLNVYSEKLQYFEALKMDLITNFNGNNTQLLNKKLDSVSELSFHYTLSQLKDAPTPAVNFFYKNTNIDDLTENDLNKLKKLVGKTKNKDWLSQINSKLDTLKAKSLKLEQVFTSNPTKEYVPYREPAPAFSGTSLKGNNISLTSVLRGKKAIVIDFWASWCRPCRALTPQVRALYNKYHSKGFDIITISEDKTKAAWQQGIAEDNMQAWHHLFDEQMIIASRYGARAIPHMVLIDGNGKVIKNKISIYQLEQELKKIFK